MSCLFAPIGRQPLRTPSLVYTRRTCVSPVANLLVRVIMPHDPFGALQKFPLASGRSLRYCAPGALESAGLGKMSRLPVSIRIVLESLLRNCDGRKITADHVRQPAGWQPTVPCQHRCRPCECAHGNGPNHFPECLGDGVHCGYRGNDRYRWRLGAEIILARARTRVLTRQIKFGVMTENAGLVERNAPL